MIIAKYHMHILKLAKITKQMYTVIRRLFGYLACLHVASYPSHIHKISCKIICCSARSSLITRSYQVYRTICCAGYSGSPPNCRREWIINVANKITKSYWQQFVPWPVKMVERAQHHILAPVQLVGQVHNVLMVQMCRLF